jgi:uncharacterized damage-inducible protein DinB
MAMMLEHLRRMARYNRWANRRLLAACGELDPAEYAKSRPAFFGSIHGTLCHLLVADRLWLARIEGLPPPHSRLDERPYPSLDELRAAREAEDARIIRLADGLDEQRLATTVHYRLVTRPEAAATPMHLCWLHLFNHQTHHRGQLHDQLSQTAVAPPPLDLIFYLREVERRS